MQGWKFNSSVSALFQQVLEGNDENSPRNPGTDKMSINGFSLISNGAIRYPLPAQADVTSCAGARVHQHVPDLL
jgi:hypothetical protein